MSIANRWEGAVDQMVINERITFERVLCPIDLTDGSDEALRYGVALAKSYDAKLFLIHCADRASIKALGGHQHVTGLIDAAVRKHLRFPISTDFTWEILVVDGDPKTSIAEEAAKRRIDLIVMQSRRRPFAAALLGSTAESVYRTAPCPLMITHPKEHRFAGATTNEIGLRRVLVGYDFSNDSELALSYGLSLAQEYEASLHILHVVPTRSTKPEPPEIAFLESEDGFRDVASRLNGVVPAAAHAWCKVKQAVRVGHPYREVLLYAEEQEIDLICMGASGTGFGMRALFGSNADRVLRQAPCPVLIARPLRPAVAPAAAQR